MNYTKGEWEVKTPEIEPQRFIIDCELPTVDGKRYHRSICRMFGYCHTQEEELANANLIASAPDMYTTLMAVSGTLLALVNSKTIDGSTFGVNERIKEINKALAKAKGK